VNYLFKNEVHLHGTLAKDPIIKFTPTGKQVATLTMTTRYKERAEFHRVVLWEDLAKKVEALHKGDFIKVVGRLQTRTWEDAAKVKHYSTEIIGFQVSLPVDDPAPEQTKPVSKPKVSGKEIAKQFWHLRANGATMTPSRPFKKITYKLDDLRPLSVNTDMENAILGACIESGTIFSAVISSGLTGDDFSTIHNQSVWNALLEMRREVHAN